MTAPNALDRETAEITRVPLGVVATWISVFAFGALFWAFVLHAAPDVVRHVYHSVRAELMNPGVHPPQRVEAQSLSGDQSSQRTFPGPSGVAFHPARAPLFFDELSSLATKSL